MSHPTRESFRQFSNLDPQARLEEFQKRFDRLKSEFPSHQMFDLGNHPFFGAPTHQPPPWTGSGENVQPQNGHVPMEKTIPIQVQHERSRSEPMETTAGPQAPNNVPNDRMQFPDPTMRFVPEGTYFHSRFPQNLPNSTSATEPGVEARVHHIPIQVESRDAPPPKPSCPHPTTTNHYYHHPEPPNTSAASHTALPTQYKVPLNHQTSENNIRSGRVIEVPIQVSNSSSTLDNTSKNEEMSQEAQNTNSEANTNITTNPSLDLNIADPSKVYAMGYSPLNATVNNDNNNQCATEASSQPSTNNNKKETPFDYVDEILNDLKNYESQVHEFNGTSQDNKGYRFLDEMLTLCVLRLDCINIDGNEELRKYRKAAINEVNRVTAILEAKVSKGKEEQAKTQQEAQQQESKNECNASSVQLSNNTNSEQKQTQQNGIVVTENNSTTTQQQPSTSNMEEPKDKKTIKKQTKVKKDKVDKDKEKEKEKDKKETKKEGGRKIILFRGKNKAKSNPSNNDQTNEVSSRKDLDPNNNDLKDGGGGGGQSSSGEQSSNEPVSSSASSSTTTLQGKETVL